MENELTQLKGKLDDECETVRELNENNEKLSDTIREKNKTIQQLTEDSEEPDKIIENGNTVDLTYLTEERTSNTDNNRYDRNKSKEKCDMNAINEMIQKTIMNEMEKMSVKIDEK